MTSEIAYKKYSFWRRVFKRRSKKETLQTEFPVNYKDSAEAKSLMAKWKRIFVKEKIRSSLTPMYPKRTKKYAFHLYDDSRENVKLQSADADASLDTTVSASSEQNVEFIGEQVEQLLSFDPPQDSSFRESEQPDINLGNFLSRPVLLESFDWTQSVFTRKTLTPWYDFLNNPAVKNKLQNFSYFSGRLHIKIVLNASPFLSGALMAAYHPLPVLSPDTDPTKDQLVCKSQRPHIWLFPQTCTGGEMVLPFFYYKNYLTLSDSQEIKDMGTLDIFEYAPLRSANGVASYATNVQVYAWVSEPLLTGGTSAVVLQSGDEYGNDPISAPASAVAMAAKTLSNIPVIGPFAKATEIGASSVSAIAKLFGYTNVPVISNSEAYKSMPFNGISSAHVSEPVEKFTLDPKGELTIDPRTTGLMNTDELAIPYIVQKESFLTKFEWETSDLTDALKFNVLVNPSLRVIEDVSSGSEICFTPMSHVSQLFNNWHGDIIFRFKFICTKFHKGRVRISWDPTGDLVTNSDTTNTVFTKIVDLDLETDVEIQVPYMQPRLWQQTRSVFIPDRPQDFQTSSFTNLYQKEVGNGTLTIRVLNRLSSPTTSSTIDVLTFVRGAENLELANPIDISDRLNQFHLQSGDDIFESSDISMGEVGHCNPNRYLINYGESVSSVRTLLRRSTLVDVIPFEREGRGNNFTYYIVRYKMNKYPIPPGFNPDVETRASTGIFSSRPYSFTHNNPFNWMQSAYIGCRGSMKWKFNFQANGSSPVESIKLTRTLDQLSQPVLSGNGVDGGENFNTLSNFIRSNTKPGLSGIVVTNQRTQVALAAELAQFNPNRFVSSSNLVTTQGLPEDNSDRETYALDLSFANEGRNDIKGTALERYASIGTDFNFFFYLNAPVSYYLKDPVTPN